MNYIHWGMFALRSAASRQKMNGVDTAIIVKQDIRPILEQIFFRFVLQHIRLPAAGLCQHFYQSIFKIRFFCECHKRCLHCSFS